MALLLTKSDSIFVHIPKTGGTWLRKAMGASGIDYVETSNQHGAIPLLIRQGILTGDLESRRLFTIVRHPITWYQSRWCFRVKYGWRAEHPLDMNCASNDFGVFVDNALKYKPDGWVSWLYSQYNENPKKKVDYIARTENLVDDCVEILKDLGESFDEEKFRNCPKSNVTVLSGKNTKHWAKYTPDLYDRVMAVEQDAIIKYYSRYDIDRNEYIGLSPAHRYPFRPDW